MFARIFAIGALFFVLAGCATYETVKTGARAQVGADVSVDPQISWAKVLIANTSGTLWTIDGVGLNELYFFTDIKQGKPLITVTGEKSKETRLYAANMLPNDVMDMLVSTVGKLGYVNVRATALAPAKFGAVKGFRFNLDFATRSGLEMRGMAIAAQRGNRLDLILFSAPAEYYFGRYAPTVEKIFSSVQAKAS